LFDSKATNVRTPPEEVLKERKGMGADVFACAGFGVLSGGGMAGSVSDG
jgi:hypothetical protein